MVPIPLNLSDIYTCNCHYFFSQTTYILSCHNYLDRPRIGRSHSDFLSSVSEELLPNIPAAPEASSTSSTKESLVFLPSTSFQVNAVNRSLGNLFDKMRKVVHYIGRREEQRQNVIFAKMNKLSKKNPADMKSARLWMEDLQENRFYSSLFSIDPDMNGPFLISWLSPWQKMVKYNTAFTKF